MQDVADAVVKAIGFTGEYRFDTTKADGQFRKPASNKKLVKLLEGTGFEFTPFDKGEQGVVGDACMGKADGRWDSARGDRAVVPPELRQRKDGSKVCLDVSCLALQDGVEVYARIGIQRLDYMYSF